MHDRTGKPLKVGDRVTVTFIIRACSADQDFCNATLDSVEVMPGNQCPVCLVLNTKQVDLID